MLTFVFALALAQAPNGQALFENTCATCHTAAGDARTPSLAALRQRSPEDIVTALTTGLMREQGADLQAAERRAIAEFLAGRVIGSAPAATAGRCSAPPAFDPTKGPKWTGWSGDITNTRFQPAADAGL